MRSEFKSATQIYVSPIYFELQVILKNDLFFCIPRPDDQNLWNRKDCSKFFHRVIFAFWIQICNPNLCKSHTFWNTANIENWPFFAKLMKSEKLPEILTYGNFCVLNSNLNPNLCKSHIFWITANIEKWSFFAYPDLMTKIDEIEKIARNSFIG